MSNQSERARIDQIVSEFFSKSLHIILDSRIPFFANRDALLRASTLATSTSVGRNPNKWFNIELDQSSTVEEHVEAWRRCTADPMIVDILLQQGTVDSSPPALRPLDTFRKQLTQVLPGSQPDALDTGESEAENLAHELGGGMEAVTVLERWIVQYERRRRPASGGGGGGAVATASGLGSSGSAPSSVGSFPGNHTVEVPVVYKRTVILLRSLYCMARTLPAHRLFRLAKANNQCRGFTLSYRVSSASSALSDADLAAMSTCRLTPVDTPTGRMSLTVAYRHATAVTALEVSPPLLPRIITDYVGSPTTDPLRRFPHSSQHSGFSATPSRRGMHVISMSSTPPSSAPVHSRRYSWSPVTGAKPVFTQPPSYALLTPTSPSGPPPRSPSSLAQVTSSHPVMIQESLYRTSSLSPSPSPSPPTPSHAPEFSIPRAPVRHTSAPVSIPRPSSRGLSMATVGSPRNVSHYRSHSADHPTPYPSQPPHLATRARPYPSQSPPWQPSSSTLLPDGLEGQLSVPGAGAVSSIGPLNASNFQGRGPLYSTPSSTGDSSGPSTSTGMSFSPPLPFASTPVRTTGFAGSETVGGHLDAGLLSVAKASPPISGRQVSALSLARQTPTSPSYSMSLEAKGRLSISPLAESSLLFSPPLPYRLPSQGGGDELLASGAARRSLYAPPRITFPGESSKSAASEPASEEEEEFACPFAVDDVDMDDRRSSQPEASATWGVPASTRGPPADAGGSQWSNDAAVGALVRMLKSAPPLRPKPGTGMSMASSPSQPSALSGSGGVPVAPRVRGGGLSAGLAQAAAGAGNMRRVKSKSSSMQTTRMVADALMELKEYSEMREALLTQRGDAGASVGTASGGTLSVRSSLERAEGSPRQGSGGLSKRSSTEGGRRFS